MNSGIASVKGGRIAVEKGLRLGRLVVGDDVEPKVYGSGRSVRQVEVICDCGVVKAMTASNLSRGTARSCGCLISENLIKRNHRHGLSRDPVYWLHQSMVSRCDDVKPKNARSYMDKGITVCSEWRDVSVFAEWAYANGYKKGLQIDRTNNAKGYSPDNCRFVTPRVNAQNRSTSFVWNIKGHTFPSCKAAGDHFGVNAQTIHNWVSRGEEGCAKRKRYGESHSVRT